MKTLEPLQEFRSMLDTVRVGMLSTIAEDGYPDARWMTATILPGEQRFLYCVSATGTRKVTEILANPRVNWSFQSMSLDRIVTIKGRASVLENPDLKAQVIEGLGQGLESFWRAHPDPRKLVVIETLIELMTVYRPMEKSSAGTNPPVAGEAHS